MFEVGSDVEHMAFMRSVGTPDGEDRRRRARFAVPEARLEVRRARLMGRRRPAANEALRLCDLSSGGAAFYARRPLPAGERVYLCLVFPAQGDELSLLGFVRRAEPLEDRPGGLPPRLWLCGIEFVTVPPLAGAMLTALRPRETMAAPASD